MSILIKGMEMSKCCGICPYNKSSCYCGITKSEIDRDYEYAERLANCPLVLVPPHGDLIDRDVLISNHTIDQYDWSEVIDVEDVRNAPIIIEAEEE